MDEMTPAQMVRNYRRLRDHKQAAEKEFKEGMVRVTDGLKVLESKILEHLTKNGLNNISSDFGTAYINTKFTATVKDRVEFLRWVIANDKWDALDVKANKTYVRTVMDEGEEVPGVKLSSINIVGIRRSPS